MTSLRSRLRLAPACLAALFSLSCDKSEPKPEAEAEAPTKKAPTQQPEQRATPVEVAGGGVKPSSDMIIEIVGGRARVATSSSSGTAVDFTKRSGNDEHLRPELARAVKDEFWKALEARRPEARIRLDAGATGLDLVDAIHTLGTVGVVEFELEFATPEGARVVDLTLPKTCFGKPTDRRCTSLHLRAVEGGTLASAILTDLITNCDVAEDDLGSFAGLNARALVPAADAACPGWPHLAPGDEGLAQLIAAVATRDPCKGVDVSVDPGVAASKFLPTFAAVAAANQAVVFRAQPKGECSSEGTVSLDALAPKPD